MEEGRETSDELKQRCTSSADKPIAQIGHSLDRSIRSEGASGSGLDDLGAGNSKEVGDGFDRTRGRMVVLGGAPASILLAAAERGMGMVAGLQVMTRWDGRWRGTNAVGAQRC